MRVIETIHGENTRKYSCDAVLTKDYITSVYCFNDSSPIHLKNFFTELTNIPLVEHVYISKYVIEIKVVVAFSKESYTWDLVQSGVSNAIKQWFSAKVEMDLASLEEDDNLTKGRWTDGQWPDNICSGYIRYAPASNYGGFSLSDASHGIPTIGAVKEDGTTIFNYPGQTEEIAKRLVVCWNVMVGLPTDEVANIKGFEIPHDFKTHREAWHDALLKAKEADRAKANNCAEHDDNEHYWDHELKAFDAAFDALEALKLPEK